MVSFKQFFLEAEANLPGAGKYKVTMPLKDINTIFMKTVENNLSVLQDVADDPQKLAAKLTDIFKPEDLNIAFEVSKDRFDDLGDGAFLHGGVEDPSKVTQGVPRVTMFLNKYTGEAIKNWDDDIDITGSQFTSAQTATGKELMAGTVRSTIMHEFIHQAQSQDPEITMGIDDEKLFDRLGELVGADPESDEFGQHMVKFIEQQVSQEFLDDMNKSEKDTEIRDIINKVYYASEDEFTGWAQGVPSDLIDAALRGKLECASCPAEIEGLLASRGAELKKGIIGIIDHLIKNADKGRPDDIAKENAALRFYGHPEGFMATYGAPGYKEFLKIAKGYAQTYPESMYNENV